MIFEEVKLNQSERNTITETLKRVVIAIYKNKGIQLESFRMGQPKIQHRLKMIQDWKLNLRKEVMEHIMKRKENSLLDMEY